MAVSTPVALPSVSSGIAPAPAPPQEQGPQQIVSLLLSDDVGVRLLSGVTHPTLHHLHHSPSDSELTSDTHHHPPR